MNLKTPSKTPLDKPETITNLEHQLQLNLNSEQTGQKSIDIAWAAGLFEGEGCIISDSSQPNARGIKMAMTDQDVMERFVRIIEYGKCNGPYKRLGKDREHHLPLYHCKITRRSEVLRILKMFLPYFGERRYAKAMEAINHIETFN